MVTTEDIFNSKRRLYERFPSRFPTKFKDSRFDFGSNVYLRNCSAQGARISTTEHLYINDSVSLEIELPDGKPPMILRGQVIWTSRQSADVWEVGIRFHKVSFMDLWRICKAVEASNTL